MKNAQNPVDSASDSTGASQPVVTADTRMDPELKAKWVAALRSGEYEQGRGALEADGKFCCLGVLCVVTNIDTHTGSHPEHYIPMPLVELTKMRFVTQESLAAKNDGGDTFPEIADYIEANL